MFETHFAGRSVFSDTANLTPAMGFPGSRSDTETRDYLPNCLPGSAW